MQNKRKHERFDGKLEIKYEALTGPAIEETDNFSDKAFLLNLSEGGILFSNSSRISASSFLKIEIIVPWKDFPIVLSGEVRRVKEIIQNKEYEIGFAFEDGDIFENDKKFIQEHIQKIQR